MAFKTSVASTMCHSCKSRYLSLQTRRSFTSTRSRHAENYDGMKLFADALGPKPARQQDRSAATPPQRGQTLRDIAITATAQASSRPSQTTSIDEPFHLNVFAHKHNLHVTFTNPSRDVILSYSAGNLGLRKAQRSTFDAAYQLSSYSFRKMLEKQWRAGGKKGNGKTQTMQNVTRIEVILRGYGPGREAFQKALLGPEGRAIKPKICQVTDSTRLKFGGVRSPNVRRLG